AYRLRYSTASIGSSTRGIKKKISLDAEENSTPVNETSKPADQDNSSLPPADAAVTETVLPLSLKPDFSTKSRFKTAPKTTVKLTDLLKVDPKKEENGSGPTQHTAQ